MPAERAKLVGGSFTQDRQQVVSEFQTEITGVSRVQARWWIACPKREPMLQGTVACSFLITRIIIRAHGEEKGFIQGCLFRPNSA